VYFRPTTDGRDIDIAIAPVASPEQYPAPVFSLGFLPLVIVIGVVVVFLAAAITTAIGFYEDSKKQEDATKKRIAELDAEAAKAGGDVAARWKQYKSDNAKANGGILASLGENMGTIAVVGGLIALAIIASKAFGGREK